MAHGTSYKFNMELGILIGNDLHPLYIVVEISTVRISDYFNVWLHTH